MGNLYDQEWEAPCEGEHVTIPDEITFESDALGGFAPGTTYDEVDQAEVASMRVFESGATRNVETDPDYHGFLSPLALHSYGEYMHRHRLQADGTMRRSDNWQLGIPNDAFVRSLVRHVHDIELIHDGYGELARQDDRDDNVLLAHLSAALFNIQGMLHNVTLALLDDERGF